MENKIILTTLQLDMLREIKPETWDDEEFDKWVETHVLVFEPLESAAITGTIKHGKFIRTEKVVFP